MLQRVPLHGGRQLVRNLALDLVNEMRCYSLNGCRHALDRRHHALTQLRLRLLYLRQLVLDLLHFGALVSGVRVDIFTLHLVPLTVLSLDFLTLERFDILPV